MPVSFKLAAPVENLMVDNDSKPTRQRPSSQHYKSRLVLELIAFLH